MYFSSLVIQSGVAIRGTCAACLHLTCHVFLPTRRGPTPKFDDAQLGPFQLGELYGGATVAFAPPGDGAFDGELHYTNPVHGRGEHYS